jgi:hypothetical protein
MLESETTSSDPATTIALAFMVPPCDAQDVCDPPR